jgi:HD-GYP domain-containing protein (c-di-GMP phosphodiesterase class II)/DNA-binding CsgD family transcriptional regulator
VGQTAIRLTEVLAALALATDLGMGQPSGHAMQTTVLAVRLARALGLSETEISDVCNVALLRYIGCTADAPEIARLAGDEIALAAAVAPHVMGDAAARIAHTAVAAPEQAMATAMAVHCEAAGMLGSRLGLNPSVTTALQHGFERWDGRGHPTGQSRDEVPPAIRIAALARDAVVWQRLAGDAAARTMVMERSGLAYDPEVVDAYLSLGDSGTDSAGQLEWTEVLASEPGPRTVSEEELDGLLEVFADFADLKLPLALGHSRRVAAVAAGAGLNLGLTDDRVRVLRRAGLVHDLGRVGISSAIWGKAEPLNTEEWERIRLHPYFTERILRRSPPLAGLATLAAAHHERLDGSGYHRGLAASGLSRPERILAAADAYVTLREPRPYRPAFDPAATVHRLRAEVETGRLDGSAVPAVVAAAGEEAPPPPHWPAGLTRREVDVLCLAARGLTIGQVATRLAISPKTVDRHLQNSYAKAGVSSRAGAALFALHHGLLSWVAGAK